MNLIECPTTLRTTTEELCLKRQETSRREILACATPFCAGCPRFSQAKPEPEQKPEPVASHADPMKAAEECQCGTTPEHDMYSQGTDYYVFCPNAECDAQTPNQKTLETAVRVWNAMQRAAKEEGK